MLRRVLISGQILVMLIASGLPVAGPPRPVAAQAAQLTTPAVGTAGAPAPTGNASVVSTAAPARSSTIVPPATPPPGTTNEDPRGVEVTAAGGTVELPGGELAIPAGALRGRSRISRYAVPFHQAHGLSRYPPIGDAIAVEARPTEGGADLTRFSRSATVRIRLDRPEIPRRQTWQPAVRVLTTTGWDLVPSVFDPTSLIVRFELVNLPAIFAVVDSAQPEGPHGWDPKDPGAVQLSDGAWGVAYHDGTLYYPKLLYRRSLGTTGPIYWLDPVTIEPGTTATTAGDTPALIRSGSPLALFYRKSDGSKKQVWVRTSTDDGLTWSGPTQLTSETVDIYQIQASVTGGTAYVFFSLSNTSGLLQYRTSNDLANWNAKASVGQAMSV